MPFSRSLLHAGTRSKGRRGGATPAACAESTWDRGNFDLGQHPSECPDPRATPLDAGRALCRRLVSHELARRWHAPSVSRGRTHPACP